jgi:AcrR family transcriptional regulator
MSERALERRPATGEDDAMADHKTQLADAALRLLAKARWSDLTLMEVARAAKVPAASLQSAVPGKPALLGAILTRIGNLTAEHYRRDAGSEDARDRLLDVALTWFETLNTRKPAVRSLYDGLKRDPLALLAARDEIIAAASWLLTLAEADTGPALPARALAFAATLARAIPLWLEDDKQMTRTMAQLDADLRRGMRLFGGRRSK